jgi:hypothetical protein
MVHNLNCLLILVTGATRIAKAKRVIGGVDDGVIHQNNVSKVVRLVPWPW